MSGKITQIGFDPATGEESYRYVILDLSKTRPGFRMRIDGDRKVIEAAGMPTVGNYFKHLDDEEECIRNVIKRTLL